MLYFELPISEYNFLKLIDTSMFDEVESTNQIDDTIRINFKTKVQLEDFQADMTGAQVYYGMTPDYELTGIGRRMQDIYDQYFVIRDK